MSGISNRTERIDTERTGKRIDPEPADQGMERTTNGHSKPHAERTERAVI